MSDDDDDQPDAANEDSSEEASGVRQKRRKRKQKLTTTLKQTPAEPELLFHYLEDMAFAEIAEAKFRIRVERDEEQGDYRVVMLIPAFQISSAMQRLSQLASGQ